MVCGHIIKRAISLGLNKVEGQTKHQKKVSQILCLGLSFYFMTKNV